MKIDELFRSNSSVSHTHYAVKTGVQIQREGMSYFDWGSSDIWQDVDYFETSSNDLTTVTLELSWL